LVLLEQNKNCIKPLLKVKRGGADVKRQTKSAKLLTMSGPPPLLEGEDAAAYDELLTQVASAVRPNSIIEDIWVRDVVDLVWEVWRLRRLKAHLMRVSAFQGLAELLAPFLGPSDAEDLAKDWAALRPKARKRVDSILASTGLTIDSVMAQTLSLKLNVIETIDHMVATAEARRNSILREIDRHRETLRQDVRRAVQHIDNRQLHVIENTSAMRSVAE
jgi:hypothetical protein